MGQSSPGVSTTAPPEWLQSTLQQVIGQAGNLMSQPYQQYPGVQVAPFTPLQQQAFSGIGSSMNSPGMDAAQSFITGKLSNPPGSNPYLGGILSQGQKSITDAYDRAVGATTARFNSPGSWGGSAQQIEQKLNNEALAKQLGDFENQVRYQDFANAQNQQMQSVPLAMQLAQGQQGLYSGGLQAGNLQQQYGQSLVNALQQDWTGANQYGWNQLGKFAGLLGPLMGGAGQQTTSQAANNPWSNALGAGLLTYGMFGK